MNRSFRLAAMAAAMVATTAYAGGNAGGRKPDDPDKVQSYKLHFAPRTCVAPKMDGKLDDACWQGVEAISDYGPCTINQSEKRIIPVTEVKLLWDDKYLYVGVKCYEDTPENMASFVHIVNDRKRSFFARDCIEMHIDGNNDEHTTFQCWLLANHEKHIYWNWDFGWGLLTDSNYGLNADWDITHSIGKDARGDYWMVEARYALAHFEIKPKVGYVFGLEPARFRYEKTLYRPDRTVLAKYSGQWLAWGSQGKNHHNADGYGKVILVEKKPASVAEGLRLAFPDLDRRRILVQTGSEYAVFDRGKTSTLTYAAKAKELIAGTRKLVDRYRAFETQVSNVVWRASENAMRGTWKQIAAFEKVECECFPVDAESSPVDAESLPRQNKDDHLKGRGKDSASTKGAGRIIDVAFIGELEKKCATWNDKLETAYWSLVRDAILKEKKTRVPVTLHPSPKAPALNSEFAQGASFLPGERKNDIVEWAKPLAGPRRKVFITVCAWGGIDAWQLAKRLDVDATIFQATGQAGAVGVNDDYFNEGLWYTPKKRDELERALKEKGPFDCYVFLGTRITTWPAELQCWILEQMLAGAKVIEKNPGTWQPYFGGAVKNPEIALGSPLGFEKMVGDTSKGVLGCKFVPASLVTEPYRSAPFGKGTYAWVLTEHTGGFCHVAEGSPAWVTTPDKIFQDEYGFAYLVRNVMQILGCREGRRAVDVGGGLAKIEAGKETSVGFRTAGADEWKGTIGWRVRDLSGKVLQEQVAAYTIPAGTNHVSLAVKPLDAGEYYLDATLYASDKKVIDFASCRLVAKNCGRFVKCGCSPNCRELLEAPAFTEVKLGARTLMRPDEPVRAMVKVAPVAKGLTLRAEIRDVRNRVIVRKDYPCDAAGGVVQVSLANVPEYDWTLANLDLSLMIDGRLLDKKTEAFFRHRGDVSDYQVFSDNPAPGGWNGKIRLSLLQNYGIDLMQCDYRPGFLWFGSDAITRDRIPGGSPDKGGSLTNPWWSKHLKSRYGRQAKALREVNGRWISLGDDSGEPHEFPRNLPDWMPVWIAIQFENCHREADRLARGGFKRAEFEATTRWWRAHGYKDRWGVDSIDNSYWHFENPIRLVAQDILKKAKDPEAVKEYVRSFKEAYGTVEKFNRACGAKIAKWEDVNAELLPTLVFDPSPEYVNFLFWLKKKYGDVAKLNAAWKTDVKDFMAIPRALIDEKQLEGVFAPSIDMQTYLEDAFIVQAKAIREGVSAVDPSIGIGFGASTLGNTFCDSIKYLDSVCPYAGSMDIELMRGQKHRYIGECIGIYGGRHVPVNMRKKQVWHGLLTGCNFGWFWAACFNYGDGSVDAGRYGAMFEAYREIKRGPASLLNRARRDNYGIRLFVSRDSGHMGPLVSDMSTGGLAQLTEALGLQYDSITSEQVANGALKREGVKVLLLNGARIVNPKEAENIRAFVKDGGTVVAAARVGIYDKAGVPQKKGVLDDVFGIVHTQFEAKPRFVDLKVEAKAKGEGEQRWSTLTGALVDTSIRAAGGDLRAPRVLATGADGAQALFVNSFGKGHAILFNFNLAVIPFLAGRGELGGVRDTLDELTKLAGVPAPAVMKTMDGQTIAGTEFTRYVRGNEIYLGVEKDGQSFEKFPMKAYIQLDRKYWVYDVRKGAKIGCTDKIPMTLTGLEFELYSLLPSEAKAIELDMPATVKAGSSLKAKAKLLTVQPRTSNFELGTRIFRFELIPAGGYDREEFLPYPWRLKDAPKGEGATEWAIGYGEKPGTKYTAVVTDVATGVSASREVTVLPQ